MSILANSNAIDNSGIYTLSRSLRFRSNATPYLTRTMSSGNTQKMLWSGWIKLGSLTLGADQKLLGCTTGAGGSGTLRMGYFNLVNVGNTGYSPYFMFYSQAIYQYYFQPSMIMRDPSAWYHLVIAIDTTQATTTDRCVMYINGVRQTSYTAYIVMPQNFNSVTLNTAITHYIGNQLTNSALETSFDGYMAEVQFIDGQSIFSNTSGTLRSDFGINSFGQTDPITGVWQPKQYTGTYGTNGFYLPFTDTSSTTNLVKDFSGNANNWTPNNISLTAGSTYDSMTDVPTLTNPTVANYAVLSPMNSIAYTGNVLAANLQIFSPTTDGFCPATIASSSGKWYYEASMTNATAAGFILGIVKTTAAQAELRNVGTGNGYSYLSSTGIKSNGSGGAGTAYGATFTTGDVIGVAYDLDGGTITFYKNGVSQGTAYTGISGEFTPAVGDAASGTGGQTAWINFGQRPFSYTPPTGYVALNTYNLPTSTILQGNKYMDATLYTGTGASQTITNAGGFKPDLVWWKTRSTSGNHGLTDSVRGVTKQLSSSDVTVAEQTTSDGITAFNSNGWSIGSGATGYSINGNTVTYVGWQWQAGQGTTSSNTSGTITSTVSVNASAGFSIVTYTGTGANATVGHGLGVAPKMIIVKRRSSAQDWPVYHASQSATPQNNTLYLNFINATAVDATMWNNTAPTSTTFSLGTGGTANQSTGTYVAYCWAEIAGFSKFGAYTGNGSADGPFTYLGFRPKFVMIKRTDNAADWYIFDTTRSIASGNNVLNYKLYPALSSAENGLSGETTSTNNIDTLSNGFKCRTLDGNLNASTGTYIYAAFAENPFRNALAR